MWKHNAKPTPANIRKRFRAAMDALASASELAQAQRPKPLGKIMTAAKNAHAWAADGYVKAGGK